MEIVAKALLVEDTVKVYFYNKETQERIPLWSKDQTNLKEVLGQEKLNSLTEQILAFQKTLGTDISEETLNKLTEEANRLLSVL